MINNLDCPGYLGRSLAICILCLLKIDFVVQGPKI